MNIVQTVVNLIFPRISPYSSSPDHYIDNKYIRSWAEILYRPVSKDIEMVYVCTPYDGAISELLNRVKRGGEFDILNDLGDIFSYRVWENSTVFMPTPDYIIPVPPDQKRKKRRGFHAASILAHMLYTRIKQDDENVKYSPLLEKKFHTRTQSSLSKEDRLKNNKQVFGYNTQLYNQTITTPDSVEYIWLVDDIVATQATISECAKILKNLFPRARVYAVVFSGN